MERIDVHTLIAARSAPLRKGRPVDPERVPDALGWWFPAIHVVSAMGSKPTARQAEWIRLVGGAIRGRSTAILRGGRGVGKTYVAARIARHWCETGCYTGEGAFQYWRLADLFDAQRAWYDRDDRSAEAPLSKARKCGLLILDELHESKETDFTASELVRLIDHRYGDMRPSLLVTNSPTPQELVRLLGASVVDRVREGGVVIECGGENVRAEIGKAMRTSNTAATAAKEVQGE